MLIEDPNVFQRDKCFPKILFRRDGRDRRDGRACDINTKVSAINEKH